MVDAHEAGDPIMSRRYRYLHLDVFTGEKFGGNQLAVLTDARGLAAATMQTVAREMNFSETTFILPAERPDTDIRMRIFTPGREMPMAGHPTIGSTFALALDGTIPAGRRRWTFGLNIGPTPVDIDWAGERPAFAWMTQQRPVFGNTVADLEGAARAIGVDATAIRATGLPVQEVSCGVPFVFIPVATRAAVDAAFPELRVFNGLCAACGVDDHAMFVFSREPGADGATVYSRMFARGQRAAGLVPGAARRGRGRTGREDPEPAGREDGAAQPRAHRDRRGCGRDHEGPGGRGSGAGG
jgi:trans-2,3-dihydro-3-hydroxyanthranilate isomerase